MINKKLRNLISTECAGVYANWKNVTTEIIYCHVKKNNSEYLNLCLNIFIPLDLRGLRRLFLSNKIVNNVENSMKKFNNILLLSYLPYPGQIQINK